MSTATYNHLIRLYKLIIAQVKSPAAANDSNHRKQIPTKIMKYAIVPDVCIVCQDDKSLKCIHKKYFYNGQSEDYSKMLLSCYNIQVKSVSETNKNLSICDACIVRLRDAANFRKQVETAHKQLYKGENFQNHADSFISQVSPQTQDKVGGDENDSLFDRDEHNSLFDEEDNSHNDDIYDNFNFNQKTEMKEPPKEKVIPPLVPFETVCPICNESFKLYSLLMKHYPVHYSDFLCEICGAPFEKIGNLKKHLLTHNDLRYPCEVCKKTFATPLNLYNHARLHAGIKKHPCRHCTERFDRLTAKNEHTLKVHGIPGKVYSCPKCPRTYINSKNLSLHVRRDHLKIKNHTCVHCGLQFYGANNLKHHLFLHTDAKNYECNECGKSFKRRRTIIEHLKIHYNIRAYVCQHCGKSFIQNCTLKGHLKTHAK